MHNELPDFKSYINTCERVDKLIKSSTRESLLNVFDELKFNIGEHDKFDVIIMLNRIEKSLSDSLQK